MFEFIRREFDDPDGIQINGINPKASYGPIFRGKFKGIKPPPSRSLKRSRKRIN